MSKLAKLRIIAAFAPHAGYSEQDFASIFEKLYSPLHGAYKAGRHVIFGGDSNFQTDVGKHGAQFASLCSGFGLKIFFLATNDDDPYVSPNNFLQPHGHNPMYIFHFSARSVCCWVLLPRICWIYDQTTQQRVRRTSLKMNPKEVRHGLHGVRRGWKLILDSYGCPT